MERAAQEIVNNGSRVVLQNPTEGMNIATIVSRVLKCYYTESEPGLRRNPFFFFLFVPETRDNRHSSMDNAYRRSANSDSRRVHCYLQSDCCVHMCACLNTCAWNAQPRMLDSRAGPNSRLNAPLRFHNRILWFIWDFDSRCYQA